MLHFLKDRVPCQGIDKENQNSDLILFIILTLIINVISIFPFTEPLRYEQDTTQSYFLREVQLVWIQFSLFLYRLPHFCQRYAKCKQIWTSGPDFFV